jgi:hypothetical protein
MHTDQSLLKLAQRLLDLADAGDAEELEAIEQLHGNRHNAFSILLDAVFSYKYATVTLYDWMHTWCIDGIWKRVFKSLQAFLAKRGKDLGEDFKPSAKDVHEYLQPWVWPRQHADGKRILESGGFDSGSASQVLAAAPVITKYFRDVVGPVAEAKGAADCTGAIALLTRASGVLELLAGASQGLGSAADLSSETFEFLDAYQERFGDANWVLKFHLAGHIALMWKVLQAEMQRRGLIAKLPNCFVTERKHKDVKRHLRDRLKMKSQERCLLEELVLDQFHAWKESGATGGLLGGHPSNAKERADLEETLGRELAADLPVQVGSQFKHPSGKRYYASDVVCTSDAMVGQITRFFFVEDRTWVQLTVWRQLSWSASSRVGVYGVSEATVLFLEAANISSAAIYKFSANGSKVTTIWSKM